MTSDPKARERLLAHCGELHEDDGVDPREFFKVDHQQNKRNHKALQLCHQVRETLELVLASEFGDERLNMLQVVSVEPGPAASQLLVTLCTDQPQDSNERQLILQRIESVSGRLRCEVAAAITRKRTPRLVFRLVCPGEEGNP